MKDFIFSFAEQEGGNNERILANAAHGVKHFPQKNHSP
jgi:hypothetical protein